jgi:signal transduction histidine kinase
VTSAPIAGRLRRWAAGVARPDGPAPRPTWRNLAFDAALAAALGIASIDYALSDQQVPAIVGPPWAVEVVAPDGYRLSSVLIALVASAALAFRRRYPLAVLMVVLSATLVAAPDEPRLTFYACIIAAYTAAGYSPYRIPSMLAIALTVLAVSRTNSPIPIVPTQYVPFAVLVPVVVAADGLRRWKIRAEKRRAQLAELERQQSDALRRATEQERARIARELHDVVTHNVSVMVIQAGAARKVMATDPERAGEALREVEAGGRAAMAELRQAIGLLTMNAESPQTDDLAPQPGLSEVETLVGRVRDAGLPVELSVAGQARPLPPGIELAAYRVLQEALTNTLKHASGASATATVDYQTDKLRVEITDTGGIPDESAGMGNGRGLDGLRERLAVYGGTLTAGRRITGGYRIEAVIPLEAS